MRFSVWPINQQPLAEIIDVVRHAEATGWDGAWVADHLMGAGAQRDAPVAESWTTLTLLAARTSRLRLGTLVASATFRHPGVLAKMAGTLAQAAPGRLVLGLGAGWQDEEHRAYGLDLPGPAARLARLAEACAVVRLLLERGGGDFAGQHHRLADARARPRPPTPIPILIGAKGDRALEVVARHADEWNLWADADVLRSRRPVLDAACARIARDPGAIRSTAQAVLLLDDGPQDDRARWERAGLPLLRGSVAQVQEQLGGFVDAGLDELVVPDFSLGRGSARLDALDRFLTEVAGPFRAAQPYSVC